MLNSYYLSKLEVGSEYIGTDLEACASIVKDVHLRLTHSTGRKYHSVSRGGTYTKATVDMYKFEYELDAGTCILVQYFDWKNGVDTLVKEERMTCDEANHLYKSLIKDGFYAR